MIFFCACVNFGNIQQIFIGFFFFFFHLVFKLQDTATRIRSERIYPRASEINRIGTCEVEDEREFV